MTVDSGKSTSAKPEHITLRLDSRIVSELRLKAAKNDRSVSAEVRQALRDWLREEEEVAA